MVLLLAATVAFTCSNLLPKLPSAIMSGVFLEVFTYTNYFATVHSKKGVGLFSSAWAYSREIMVFLLHGLHSLHA